MEFGNPIVGQEDLIREAIKSPNYSNDPEAGVSGWRIARDGSATFYNLTVGNDAYFIDENGNAVFNSVSAASISLDGTPLSELLAAQSKGVLAVVTLPTNTASYDGTNRLIFGRITIPNFDATRQYKVGVSGHFNVGTAVTSYILMRCQYRWDSKALVTDPVLFQEQHGGRDSGASSDWVFNIEWTFGDSTPGGTDMHLVFTLANGGTGGNFQGDPMYRVWVEDAGPIAQVTSYDPATDQSPTQQYTKTYTCTFSDSFQEDGTDRNIDELYQGHYSSTNGNQYSLMMFDYATMQADLSGATIDDVNVYLNNNHSYFNAGMTAVLGTHNKSDIGGDQSYTNVNPDITREDFAKGESKWFDVPNSIAENIRDNTAKGLLLGKGPSDANEYYGYFAGYNQSGPPKIQVTYTK